MKKKLEIKKTGARNWTIIGISFAGCFLFALYLIYDLQLIMGAFPFFFSGQLRPRERNLGGKTSAKKTHFFFKKKKHKITKKKKKTFSPGGKTVALGPDEYVFASLSIYLDVINIFLMILQLVAAFQRE